LLVVVAVAVATWYGFLAHTHGHPTVRLSGALALTGSTPSVEVAAASCL
jgi:hypothetical protein